MSDIVEWLREMQDEYAPGGGGVQYHERYKEAADRIEAGSAWQTAFHKEHDDLCKVESRNYVLEKGVTQLTQSCIRLRAALREIVVARRTHETVSYWTDIEVEMLKDIAREALEEE